jgi:ankyrin repeat protein
MLLVMVVAEAGLGRAQGFSDEATIHEMAARDDVPGIAKAISAGVPVDVRDPAGETALHVAVREVHLFAAMMLIAKGANPNARDANGRIPLHLAAAGDARRAAERYQIVKLLVGKGSARDALDADGKRPVDYAETVEFRQALAPPVTSRKASPRRSRDSP